MTPLKEKLHKMITRKRLAVLMVACVLTGFSLYCLIGPPSHSENVFSTLGHAFVWPHYMAGLGGMIVMSIFAPISALFPEHGSIVIIWITSVFLVSLFYASIIVRIFKWLEQLGRGKTMWLSRFFRASYVIGISAFLMAVMLNNPAVLSTPKPELVKASCSANLRQIGVMLRMYANQNQGMLPAGATSGEVFRTLEEERFLDNRELLSCPGNPVAKVDFDDPEGVSYYIDPAIPDDRHPQRAIAADRSPWELNHDGKGVNVLFANGAVKFIRPEDSGPPDKISNPYIEEDYDIYADTGDPEKHAWIRWEREPEQKENLD